MADSYRGSRSSWALLALAVCLLFVGRRDLRHTWKASLANIGLLKNLCDSASGCPGLDVEHAYLTPVRPLPAAWSTADGLDDCQLLWASRLAAAESTEIARALLDRATDCPREKLKTWWSGHIDWLEGNEALAVQTWSRLPADYLIQLGHWFILDGQRDKGKDLLWSLARQEEIHLSSEQWFQLYSSLGDAYFEERSWSEAAGHYSRALQVRNDSKLSYRLGRAYRLLGRYSDALTVLEADRAHVGSRHPVLVSNYYMELGQVYAALGQRENALSAYRAAVRVLRERGDMLSPEHLQRQKEVLADLIASLGPGG